MKKAKNHKNAGRRITIRLTPILENGLIELAAKDSRKKSDYVRKILLDHVRYVNAAAK